MILTEIDKEPLLHACDAHIGLELNIAYRW